MNCSEMVNYALVLAEYGGDSSKGRTAYRKQLLADTVDGLDVKTDIFSQSILGGEDFIAWVKGTIVKNSTSREQPTVGKIKYYRQKETILTLIEAETGKDIEALKTGKGDLRRLTMDLLYRFGGLQGPEIGALFGVDYSAVSQERKRLRDRVASDRKLQALSERLERELSTIKI